MPKKEKKDRPIFKGRSHKSFLNQCRLKLVTLGHCPPFIKYNLLNLFVFFDLKRFDQMVLTIISQDIEELIDRDCLGQR